MKLESVNKETTKMLSALDTAVAKTLVEQAKDNTQLALIIMLYNYAIELDKTDDTFLSGLEGRITQLKYKELNTVKERAEYIDEHLDPSPFTKFFEENCPELLSKIRYLQDSEEYTNTIGNPVLLTIAYLDKDNELFLTSISEWLEINLERFGELLNQAYTRLSIKNKIKETPKKKGIVDKKLLNSDEFPDGLTKVQKYMLLKEGYNLDRSRDYDPNSNALIKVNKYYADYLDKKYSKIIQKYNPFLKRITYKSMVEDYFGNGFVYQEGDNAPRLSRQLTKANIDYTDEEVRHFGEVKKFWNKWYFQNRSISRDTKKSHGIYIDTENFNIPDIVDRFAFKDSCNNSDSSAGRDTHLILRNLGMQYIKGYSLHRKGKKIGLVPSFRTYFKKEGDELAHAGSYSDGWSDYNYLNYEFTTVLLCILFGRKIDDFKSISGMEASCKTYYDNDGVGFIFWSNMGNNGYSKYGTAELLKDIDGSTICHEVDKFDFVGVRTIISHLNDNMSTREILNYYLSYSKIIPLTTNIHTIFN